MSDTAQTEGMPAQMDDASPAPNGEASPVVEQPTPPADDMPAFPISGEGFEAFFLKWEERIMAKMHQAMTDRGVPGGAA